jgi:hypothetical protein
VILSPIKEGLMADNPCKNYLFKVYDVTFNVDAGTTYFEAVAHEKDNTCGDYTNPKFQMNLPQVASEDPKEAIKKLKKALLAAFVDLD